MNMINRKIKVILSLFVFSLAFTLTGCGSNGSGSGNVNIALITDVGTIHDNSYNENAWKGITRYISENDTTAKYYQSISATKEAYTEQIKNAVNDGAQIVVCPGYLFENTVFDVQKQYKKVDFILLDGVPHNEDYSDMTIGENVMPITFAEEQAGFLAGYSAVREGYTNLGFIGGIPEESVIRYGYGFVQGADFAAIQTGMPISIRYTYTNTYNEDVKVEQIAASWYENDTEIIFACGGSMGMSVIRAAEEHNGKVIGVDVDQTYISPVVVTSAIKGLDSAVYMGIKAYYEGNFKGGEITHLTARENGVKLPISGSKFETFQLEDYSYIYDLLVDGFIEVYADSSVGTCEELLLVNTEISYIVPD